MITLEVNPAVLQALKVAFPRPNGSAERALSKYVQVLTRFLNQSVHRGRDPLQVRFSFYSVPTSTLANLGGSIGPNKVRVHKWLQSNGLALIEQQITGSNLTGQVSSVSLSNQVQLHDDWDEVSQVIEEAETDLAIDQAILGKYEHQLAIFQDVYPGFDSSWSGDELAERFDELPVDVKSLMAYIYWLRTGVNRKSRLSVEHACSQAHTILAIARILNRPGF
jgi:hypothetical protein